MPMKRFHHLIALPLVMLSSMATAAENRCFDAIAIGMGRDELIARCGHPIDEGHQDKSVKKSVEVYRGLDSQRESVQFTTHTEFLQYQEPDGSVIRFQVIDGYVVDKQRHHHSRD